MACLSKHWAFFQLCQKYLLETLSFRQSRKEEYSTEELLIEWVWQKLGMQTLEYRSWQPGNRDPLEWGRKWNFIVTKAVIRSRVNTFSDGNGSEQCSRPTTNYSPITAAALMKVAEENPKLAEKMTLTQVEYSKPTVHSSVDDGPNFKKNI